MRGGTVQINWHETQPVLTLDFHPQSGILATGGNDHDIKLWSIKSDDSEKKLPTASYQNSLSYHSSAVNILRFSPSGENIASGADGGELVIWKLNITDDGQAWKVMKTLLFHRKDVLDLQWSPDGSYIISGSVDNSCIIWDVDKGSVQQILDAHMHYVQGVAWDPLKHYVASISSDRTCRIYANKPLNKNKGGIDKLNFVCQHVLMKSDPQKLDESKPLPSKTHLFHDETLPSFFRRLAWSPDGSFLLVPAGTYKHSSASEVVNTAYILSRKDLSRPAIQLPGASKPIVAVRFCPVIFSLQSSNSASAAGAFRLPYRIIFAMATMNSLYIYDTESLPPIAIFSGLHYAAITDIAWSPDAKFISLSSKDGYCTVIEFEQDELGQPYQTAEAKVVQDGTANQFGIEHAALDKMVIDQTEPAAVKVEIVLTKRVAEDRVRPENQSDIEHAAIDTMVIDQTELTAAKVEVEDVSTKRVAEDRPNKVSNLEKKSDGKKPTRKRITPIAIID